MSAWGYAWVRILGQSPGHSPSIGPSTECISLPPEVGSTVSHVAAICLSLSSNVSGLFVFPQACELHMPQMSVRCPFHELKLAYQFGLEPLIFSSVRPCPHRPSRFSGRLVKGQISVSSVLIFANNCSRMAGVKPLRVREAYMRLLPS